MGKLNVSEGSESSTAGRDIVSIYGERRRLQNGKPQISLVHLILHIVTIFLIIVSIILIMKRREAMGEKAVREVVKSFESEITHVLQEGQLQRDARVGKLLAKLDAIYAVTNEFSEPESRYLIGLKNTIIASMNEAVNDHGMVPVELSPERQIYIEQKFNALLERVTKIETIIETEAKRYSEDRKEVISLLKGQP